MVFDERALLHLNFETENHSSKLSSVISWAVTEKVITMNIVLS